MLLVPLFCRGGVDQNDRHDHRNASQCQPQRRVGTI